MVKQIKVVKIKKRWIIFKFPEPTLEHEKRALEWLACNTMSLEESNVFVHKVKGVRAQALRERNVMTLAYQRLRERWDRPLDNKYHEWCEWFRKYGHSKKRAK